ncbi:MAG TPA: phosphomannomutase/phosphoglucomutase, partial [Caulobacteraceae bacterium]|nr:phosphomannomutase/phosphoglucomutase [Caulobacteraceae bacterium]
HIFFADRWDGTDDALYVAMRLLCVLSKSGARLSDFRNGLPAAIATPELRIPCPEDRRRRVVAEVAERLAGSVVNITDGLRVTTEDGWWLLRASNTEAKLTCRCEAPDAERLARVKADLAAHLRESGISLAV